jgi:hypothetical protein
VALVIGGFSLICWGCGIEPFSEAFITSGSSLTTLGFARPESAWVDALTFVEAGIGLGIVGLMISYLPTIYGAFARREALVGVARGACRAPTIAGGALHPLRPDRPPAVPRGRRVREVGVVVHRHRGESHEPPGARVLPLAARRALVDHGRWLRARQCSTARLDHRRTARRSRRRRAAHGLLTLRRIADFFGIAYDPAPSPTDPITVSRREFDLMVVELRAAGVPLKADLDRAWRDFAGLRVNYDTVLVQLAALVMAPPGRWTTDRGDVRAPIPSVTPSVLRRVTTRRRTR